MKNLALMLLCLFACTLGKLYSMEKDLVGSLKYPMDTAPPVIQPATGKNYAISDTCDQITLTDGKQYFIRILDQDNYNYFYTICGDKDDRVYMMPVRRVRSLRRAPKRAAAGKPGYKTSSAAIGCFIALGVVLLGILALLFAVFLLSF